MTNGPETPVGSAGRRRLPARPVLAALAALATLACHPGCDRQRAGLPPEGAPLSDRLLVGAYYYTWYPRHFGLGVLRRRLVPPQPPEAGWYRSGDPAVAERHIDQAASHGIDFFAVDWWPSRPEQNRALLEGLLAAPNIADIRFCVFYETWNLGFSRSQGATVFDAAKRRRLVEDLESLARTLFAHPSYLRLGGRPVVVLYLARTFAGEYAEAIQEGRDAVRRIAGADPLLVADEVFWDALPEDAGRGGGWEHTDRPQVRRMGLFDAVTAYNMYESARPAHAGYGGGSTFLEETASRYRFLADSLPERVAFVPGVIPGYNDRGTRPAQEHYAIPRQISPGAREGSFLAAMWRRAARPVVDPRLPMVLVTSWNEWNEDTAIEPLREAPPTTRDQSPTGELLTQGYAYAGHGVAYLETVRDLACAAAGTVRMPGGGPAAGVEVLLRRGAAAPARDVTDSRGRFCVSRLHVTPGPATLEASGGPAVRVVVDAEACLSTDLEAGAARLDSSRRGTL